MEEFCPMLLSLFPTQPTDILHDTAFQFIVLSIVTLVAGCIGAIIAYWIFRKQRIRKEISYRVLSNAPVASISPDMVNDVEIRFNGQRVIGLRLLVLELQNSGNISVKPEDYIEPITFEFGREVLDANILYTQPENLFTSESRMTFIKPEVIETKIDNINSLDYDYIEKQKLKHFNLLQLFHNFLTRNQKVQYPKPNCVKLSPILLKPGELIVFKVLFVGQINKVYGRARIVDGNLVEKFLELINVKDIRTIRISPLVYSFALSILFLILYYNVNYNISNKSVNDLVTSFTIAISISISFLIFFIESVLFFFVYLIIIIFIYLSKKKTIIKW